VPIHREEVLQRMQAERHVAQLAGSPHESAFLPEFA
jgi:hypothetical protein